MSERILSVLVEDKPGVLARISSTISRRGFNINSLSVGPTNIEGRSKMTIVTSKNIHLHGCDFFIQRGNDPTKCGSYIYCFRGVSGFLKGGGGK